MAKIVSKKLGWERHRVRRSTFRSEIVLQLRSKANELRTIETSVKVPVNPASKPIDNGALIHAHTFTVRY